jgi:hypothetical protein
MTADSLQIEYLVYEPIVLRITLHVDAAIIPAVDPLAAAKQRRTIRRNLSGELWRNNEKCCTAMLGGGGFDLPPASATTLHALVIGLLGDIIPQEKTDSGFRFWKFPGQYLLVVVDEEHGLRSNAVPISIVAPHGHNARASEVFAAGGIQTLLSLLSVENVNSAATTFQKLVARYPETVSGRYARIILALCNVEKRGAERCETDAETSVIWSSALQEAADLFAPGHPLRSRALLRLARFRSDAGDGFAKAINALLSETDDGIFCAEAREQLTASIKWRGTQAEQK